MKKSYHTVYEPRLTVREHLGLADSAQGDMLPVAEGSIPCPDCEGLGKTAEDRVCPLCQGLTMLSKEHWARICNEIDRMFAAMAYSINEKDMNNE